MMPIIRLFIVLCLCLFSGAYRVAVAAENTDPLVFFLDKLESYQADFKQTLSDERSKVLETSTGKLYMQNPGKYRWEYVHPYSQLLITDSDTLWIYDEDLAQVTIRNVTGAIDNTPAAIISGQQNIKEHFVVENIGVIEGFDFLELTPRDIDSQYRRVHLGFDKNNLIMMILSDNLGQTTRIDFLNPVRNRKLSGTLFNFDLPKNVDVIDERQVEQNKN